MSPGPTDARAQTILRGLRASLSGGRPAARDAGVVALLERTVAGAMRRAGDEAEPPVFPRLPAP